jgi:hypothetical protein
MGIAEMALLGAGNTTREGEVWLTGDLLHPMSVSLEELRRHDSVTVDPFELRCFTIKRFIRTADRYRGPLLTELLSRAGLRSESPGDFKRMVFFAVGHDGYTVTFSWMSCSTHRLARR